MVVSLLEEFRKVMGRFSPRKIYWAGRVKNYHIGPYSITIDEKHGEFWVYDMKNEHVIRTEDELKEVLRYLEGL